MYICEMLELLPVHPRSSGDQAPSFPTDQLCGISNVKNLEHENVVIKQLSSSACFTFV